jgi:hypothetical protein
MKGGWLLIFCTAKEADGAGDVVKKIEPSAKFMCENL